MFCDAAKVDFNRQQNKVGLLSLYQSRYFLYKWIFNRYQKQKEWKE